MYACTCYDCDHEWEGKTATDADTGDTYCADNECPECGSDDFDCDDGKVRPDPDREKFHADL